DLGRERPGRHDVQLHAVRRAIVGGNVSSSPQGRTGRREVWQMSEETDWRPSPLRMLLVEDSESDTLLLLHELQAGGFDVSYTRVQTLDELRDAVRDDGWHLVVSDCSLPTMTAHDVLDVLTAERPYLPCIVMSGTIAEETAVDLLKRGARDFVVKHRAYRLVPAIERELREAEQRRKKREAEAALKEARE